MHLSAKLIAVAFLVVCSLLPAVPAHAEDRSAQTVWRLLDYVSVDYSEAVSDGRVVNAAEYAEMVEFTNSVRERIAALPATDAQPSLGNQAEVLQAAVQRMAPSDEVARLARKLAGDLLAAYPMALAPSRAPDVARAATLYREQCAACHGASGAGDGPNAKGMDPPPVAFTDEARARLRSVFGLYQVIDLGLDGTAMASFAHLPADERWALAFYVGQLAYSNAEAKRGDQLWRSDAKLRGLFPTLEAVTQMTPAALADQVGEDQARALIAFLRRNPGSAGNRPGGTLAIARERLADSVDAYRSGDRRKAADLALAAYLDGFEPVEPVLAVRDAALLRGVEEAMADLRTAINRGAPVADVQAKSERIGGLVDAAERVLSAEEASWGSSFVGALTILLREGLEALLIVVAMIAFLRKAERTELMPYVHAGWGAALLAGGLTWLAATRLVSISGASRELTEGFGSLIAAAVLVSVGIWMHGKGQANAWQKYVEEKLTRALSRKSAWFLFLLAFIVVYREVFETILFFTALWSEGAGMALLSGSAVAIAILAAIALALLRYARRLPIAQFFSFSSILIAGLAVVLAGKGIAGLQEAGLLDSWPVGSLPRIEILGVYPTREGILAQFLTLGFMLTGFWYTRRK